MDAVLVDSDQATLVWSYLQKARDLRSDEICLLLASKYLYSR